MTLSEIASVSGKGGLFKVIAPAKSAIVLQSLDEAKSKIVATSHHRVSLLHEISIYTTGSDGTVPLEDVLQKMYAEFGNDPGVDTSSEPAELKSFLKSVLPEYDEDRVYVSDIKKIVKWYDILLRFAPEIIKGTQEEKSKSKDAPENKKKAE